MAIAYKSQGAGASTETSGAALSPLCPAVVDANDILIAHVFWESNVTSPSTPSGWTLLSGPHLIETSVARHWVFGKIAAGTEDGAAVAFGTPAVTTQRAARVYSFSGWVSGTITELVTDFSHQSHATDPQMPSVTTTRTGAMAVSLVAQNDNNAFVNATGETGGDWVEAVAEYTVALTPGFSLGIQTCIPTANPGTVSGGTIATTNDPCGVIGFQILTQPAVPVTVTPATAALSDTQFAPTVLTPRVCIPGTAALSDTQFAPSAIVNNIVVPGTASLSDTQFAPTITVGAAVVVIPATASLSDTQFAPTVIVSDNKVVVPATAALSDTQFAPTVLTPRVAVPATRALVLTGFAPKVWTHAFAPQNFTGDYDAHAPGGVVLDGANVETLVDLSANGRDLTMLTTANQPSDANVAGVDCVFFDQTGNFGASGERLDAASGVSWEDFFGAPATAEFTAAMRIRVPVNPYANEGAGAEQTNALLFGGIAMRRHSTAGPGGTPQNQIGMSNWGSGFVANIHMAEMPALDTWFDVVVRKSGTDVWVDVHPVGGSNTKSTFTATSTAFEISGDPMLMGLHTVAAGSWGEF